MARYECSKCAKKSDSFVVREYNGVCPDCHRTASECPVCSGKGTVRVSGQMSDYVAYGDIPCPLCDGAKSVTTGGLRRLAEDRIALADELRSLKLHIALYRDSRDGKNLEGVYIGAPRPGIGAALWDEYLEKASARVPRLPTSRGETK